MVQIKRIEVRNYKLQLPWFTYRKYCKGHKYQKSYHMAAINKMSQIWKKEIPKSTENSF